MTARFVPELDADDPYARGAQTFPVLSEEMAARVAAYGTEERLAAGDLVFERGQRSVDFFLIRDGEIEIFDIGDVGQPNVFTTHAARQFTGELDLFNDREIQAAVFLSRTVAHVHILVRGPSLAATMSDYLVQRILGSMKITLHPHTEITALDGGPMLERVTWIENGAVSEHAIGNIFVMIGAVPNTAWLGKCLDLDRQGFVRTGSAESAYATTRPGVYAVGDVRSGSVKRVASGVGEGSVVIAAVHKYLEGLHE